jgi:hypothetical protein
MKDRSFQPRAEEGPSRYFDMRPMDLREARVRLEGALELVEAGTERYRAALPAVVHVRASRAELELLVDAEPALEKAAAAVEKLEARTGLNELKRALGRLGVARRALRLRVRKALKRLGVDAPQPSLAAEVQLLLDHTLPPGSKVKLARFELKSRADFALAWACVLSAMLFFGAAAFAPDLAWLAAAVPMIGAITAYAGTRRALNVYPDRVRLVPRVGHAIELPLTRIQQLGPLHLRTDFARGELSTLIELLKEPCFARAAEASTEELFEAEPAGGGEAFAVIASTDSALLIAEREKTTLDVAVGESREWTQPRAALLTRLLVRLPAADRNAITARLKEAGLARSVTREALERAFRRTE